ncbi:tyrosine-protein phosphatase non-receptor type 61F [Apis mellifera caucasica]|nr:tyrosine-protein phosphatase non-receptor type 61F [Apis mellifera caucasica]
MCGRAACSLNPDSLCRACDYKDATGKRRTTSWTKTDIEYVPSTNIGPKDALPCIISGLHFGKEDEQILCAMMWSMIPPWHEGDYRKHNLSTHNARLENIKNSKLYGTPLRKGQRCIVLCEGYYEWKAGKTKKESKQPYYIYATQEKGVRADDSSTWKDEWSEETGWKGFKLLKMAGIFNIFKTGEIWLNEKLTIDEVVDKLNKLTLSDGDLNWHTVSTLVNNVLCKNEDCRKEKKSMLTDLETKESREIFHFHYTTWPDFGVPQSPTAFLNFLTDVRQSGTLDQNVGPPVVHCSAGIGRSGTFCLVDTCLVLIEENGLNSVNIRDILIEMRRSRMGLIQTPDQLRFSYAAIIEGAKQLPSNNVNINNEIVSNHYDVVSNISNSSNEEEDEPPPLPPPRGESLTRSMMADLTSSTISRNDELTGPPDKPLPREPSIQTETSITSNLQTGVNSTVITNNVHEQNSDGVVVPNDNASDGENSIQTISPPSSPDMKNEIRHRNKEKKERLAAQVREMKRRQKETEEWQKLKRSLFKPLTIGIGAAIVGGGIIAICGYLYMRG